MRKHEEDDHQKAVIKWCRLNKNKYPGMQKAFFIPNGTTLAGNNEFIVGRNGKKIPKSMLRGKRLKQMGLTGGVADLFVPVRRFVYPGLFLEMKAEEGCLSGDQIAFGISMIEEGYAYHEAYGIDEAIDILVGYYTGIRPSTGKAFQSVKLERSRLAAFTDEFEDLPF